MPHTQTNLNGTTEKFVAELTDAAYRVALKHGFKGTFIDIQLDLWAALRGIVRREVVLVYLSNLPGPRYVLSPGPFAEEAVL